MGKVCNVSFRRFLNSKMEANVPVQTPDLFVRRFSSVENVRADLIESGNLR